jgi:hypothetical protein
MYAYSMKRPLLIALSLTALAVAGFVGWFVFFNQSPKAPSVTPGVNSQVVMVVKYVGGLCPSYDSKGGCSTEYKLYDDGNFEGHYKVSSDEINRLKATIEGSDLTTYKTKSNPKCQSFVDGQDEVLSFPQKYPDQTFTTCMLEIPSNDSLISLVHSLIQSHEVNE